MTQSSHAHASQPAGEQLDGAGYDGRGVGPYALNSVVTGDARGQDGRRLTPGLGRGWFLNSSRAWKVITQSRPIFFALIRPCLQSNLTRCSDNFNEPVGKKQPGLTYDDGHPAKGGRGK